jgi:hypothetical protein
VPNRQGELDLGEADLRVGEVGGEEVGEEGAFGPGSAEAEDRHPLTLGDMRAVAVEEGEEGELGGGLREGRVELGGMLVLLASGGEHLLVEAGAGEDLGIVGGKEVPDTSEPGPPTDVSAMV